MKRSLRIYGAHTRRGRKRLERLLGRGRLVLDRKTLRKVERIVTRVRRGGDGALLEAVRKYDGLEAGGIADLKLAPAESDRGAWDLPEGFATALDRAVAAVEAFHRPQVHPGYALPGEENPQDDGIQLVEHRRALRRVAVYIPGGRASYPSTAVMTVVPAQLAGVEEIVAVTPPRAYRAMPALRYTLDRLGVREVWGMGGAHAVAALAYGTESVPRVDKIVGPGNAWVTAAKRTVVGDVAIDGLAGPTEVVIAADGDTDPATDPRWVAADLLAQAEHDPLAAAVLITDRRRFAKAVAKAVEEQLDDLATADTARASLRRFGCALVVESMDEALPLIQAIAPEHLQLVGPEAEALEPRVTHAGAVFLGAATPEVFGDYVAGPSHVLPTCGSARFSSALGVEDFIRRSHTVRFSPSAAERWAEAAAVLADAEGLPAHAEAARRRMRS
ncbi:MAG: histidinol dehydrogenase [Acidobacteriota bacterium]|nr:histidinol dehydrogenase [Acidobacteriota bacterium]